jgi:amphi-Trp domain-containing protein
MTNKKTCNVGYFDLKEICKIFNEYEHLLGTRITIHKKGFDDLMESFIKAIMAVPIDRKEDVPEDVMAFFKALPLECFEAAHVAAPTPAETIVYADDGIPEFEPKAGETPDGGATIADTVIGNLPPHKDGIMRPVPLKEGRLKVKTTIGLMETIRRLEGLVAALKNGRIIIESRNRLILMKPVDPVKIKIEAEVQKEKKNRQEQQMTIELEWQRANAVDWNVNDYAISVMKEK